MNSIGRRLAQVSLAVLTALLALAVTAPTASAAVRSWSPDPFPYPGNWHCAEVPSGYVSITACLINSNDGTQPVYKSVLIVYNDNSSGIQMSAAVANMWSTPSPAKLIQGDSCYDSGLSAHYGAACYGTAVKRSTVCAIRPNAVYITANVAVSFGGSRHTVFSPGLAVNC